MESNMDVTLDPTKEVEVKLTAEQWANILVGVDELPRRVAQPIVAIVNAAMIKAAKDGEEGAVVVPENGEAGA